MSKLDLFLLGVIQKKPSSPYDISVYIKKNHLNNFVKISRAAVFTNINRLEKKGYISGEVIQQGKLPSKTIYSVTEEGAQRFKDLVETQVKEPLCYFLDDNIMFAHFDLLRARDKKEIIRLFEDKLEAKLNELQEIKRKLGRTSDFDLTQQQVIVYKSIQNWLYQCTGRKIKPGKESSKPVFGFDFMIKLWLSLVIFIAIIVILELFFL